MVNLALRTRPTDKTPIQSGLGNKVSSRYHTFLDRACAITARVYGLRQENRPLSLQVPRTCCGAVKAVKKVLSNPLDVALNGAEPKWFLPLDVLRRNERIGLLASFASFKKRLPEPCKCELDRLAKDWREKVTGPAPELLEGYLQHTIEITRELFPRGWDKGYEKKSGVQLSLTFCMR
jgi:hypothetical protein